MRMQARSIAPQPRRVFGKTGIGEQEFLRNDDSKSASQLLGEQCSFAATEGMKLVVRDAAFLSPSRRCAMERVTLPANMAW
jgi:hypothetical protein